MSKTKKGPHTLQGSGENERPHCITDSGLKIGEYRRVMSENVSGPNGREQVVIHLLAGTGTRKIL